VRPGRHGDPGHGDDRRAHGVPPGRRPRSPRRGRVRGGEPGHRSRRAGGGRRGRGPSVRVPLLSGGVAGLRQRVPPGEGPGRGGRPDIGSGARDPPADPCLRPAPAVVGGDASRFGPSDGRGGRGPRHTAARADLRRGRRPRAGGCRRSGGERERNVRPPGPRRPDRRRARRPPGRPPAPEGPPGAGDSPSSRASPGPAAVGYHAGGPGGRFPGRRAGRGGGVRSPQDPAAGRVRPSACERGDSNPHALPGTGS
jgi:hypothetical protein